MIQHSITPRQFAGDCSFGSILIDPDLPGDGPEVDGYLRFDPCPLQEMGRTRGLSLQTKRATRTLVRLETTTA
jgi:hypothetical protein